MRQFLVREIDAAFSAFGAPLAPAFPSCSDVATYGGQ
jgi:hypothetical protein